MYIQGIFIVLILAVAAQGPPVLVATDKAAYEPGDVVTITVQVQQPLDDLELWVYVDQPNLYNLNATCLWNPQPNTVFIWPVKLPPNAQSGRWVITVSWNHHLTQTSFQVAGNHGSIPEFSGLAAVAFASLATSEILVRRRRH
jgi:hypothetical protein